MKVGILGAGVMGMTLAYRLASEGHRVYVLEAAPQLGGLSTWKDYGEFIFDKYYHVILSSDTETLALIDELGLSEKMVWKPTKTGFLWKGSHVSMSNYKEFITFPPLNFLQKIRLAGGILYSQYLENPSRLESVTAEKWLKNVFGKPVYHTVWEPLLESKFGALKEKVPATILHSIIQRYASTRSKTDGKEWMGHLRGEGLKVLFDTLQERILSMGGAVSCGSGVSRIVRTEGRTAIKTDRETVECDRVISTAPTRVLKTLSNELEGMALTEKPPQFLGVIRLALVLKQSLSPYYVTNLIDKGFPFTGIIEVSNLTEEDELAGRHLVMVPRYDLPDSEWFEKKDEEVQSRFTESLKKIWPDLESLTLRSYIDKSRIVQALWIDSPPSHPRPPRTSDGKIWSVNSELAGRDTLNNNAIIGVANRAAKEFCGK